METWTSRLGSKPRLSGLGSGLEEVFVFDSKSDNRDRSVEAVESVTEALGLGLGGRDASPHEWHPD